ncbi:putative telomere-binding alpha subunit central domain-containing protein [Erysiphe neolycopersici]|uniref:Protection of telomeres protein 1 n=1 Tax=Erysiphe neolycopersici TaxID=212602 RepID=A0A420HNJ2_9PEZI|nr:putative telomere-binding alpha subunit central domain-containing protein [Erysiphe neolycopersici]
MELPQPLDGYYSVQQIWNLPEHLKDGHQCSIIGFINNFRPPIKTQGTSWKCTLDIVDHSIRERKTGLDINIFWPEARMPSTPSFADVIIVSQAKTQTHGGYLSLVASFKTHIFILPANEIPKKTNDAAKLKNSWISYSYDRGSSNRKSTAPSVSETRYAISMNNKRNDITALTVRSGFDSRSDSMRNAKEKFGLVKDVKVGFFYNIIGEVRRFWPSSEACATVYLSDYTANNQLFEYDMANESPDSYDLDGDGFNYTSALKKKTKIPGPYGKLIIQITFWDEDAAFIRDHVGCGHWLYIKNIRFKIGQNDLLEGVVHSEEGKIHIQNIKIGSCPLEINKRLKTALQRKQAWWSDFEQHLVGERKKQPIETTRSKRKYDDENELPASRNKNSKQRRKKVKIEAGKNAAKKDAKSAACLGLNENGESKIFGHFWLSTDLTSKVHDIYPEQIIVPLRTVLLNSQLSKPGLDIVYAPFSNFKYRVIARVVDYFPHKLEDFAVLCSETLSYLSPDSNEVEDYCSNEVKKWEWRFSLLLEEASMTKTQNKERVWVIVDNHAAQGLLNIEEDAADLRTNQDLLVKVKEQLFKLWGDLEEQKSVLIQKPAEGSRNELPSSSIDSETSSLSSNVNIGIQPDLDSENEISNQNLQFDKEAPTSHVKPGYITNSFHAKSDVAETLDLSRLSTKITPSNKAFKCCIQQYGVKVPENDVSKADAGNHQRWQRLYGLFGTIIL